MKKYLVIKNFESINSAHIYETLDTKQDALAMRDILQKNEASDTTKYYVFQIVG
jgi:hypothetical protein